MSDKFKFKPSNPGTETVPKYRSVVEKDGDVKLIPDGKRYLFDEIQSYAEECDINNIIRRYTAGDVSALSQVQGSYSDVIGVPQTRQEALQAIMDAQATFDSLPSDIRSRFDNSWEQFFLAGNSKEVVQAIVEAYSPIETPPTGSDETKE